MNDIKVIEPISKHTKEFDTVDEFNLYYNKNKEEMDKLKNVATLGTPLQFIKGNGEYVGVFVISSIESSTEQTSSEGDILSIQVELKLLEYTGKLPEEKEQEGGLKTK